MGGWATNRTKMLNNSTERFVAIFALQNFQKWHIPGTFTFEIYETAKDLALGEKRTINKFLVKNLISDAKKTLKRHREKAIFVDLQSFQDTGISLEDSVVDYLSPERQLIYNDLIVRIREACESIHDLAPSVFNQMLDGYTAKIIAQRLNISESMVKKLRLEIKKIARIIIQN